MDYFQEKRYNRIFTDNLYLLATSNSEDRYEFKVSGSTQNVYTIVINKNAKKIGCDCPDAKSHASKTNCVCKHCCFVLCKVLKCIDISSAFFSTLTFSNDELALIAVKTNQVSMTDKDYCNQSFIDRFIKLTSQGKPAGSYEVTKAIDKNDECPICFSEFESAEKCVECPVCTNHIHRDCMVKWVNTGNDSCVYCRSKVWSTSELGTEAEGEYIQI